MFYLFSGVKLIKRKKTISNKMLFHSDYKFSFTKHNNPIFHLFSRSKPKQLGDSKPSLCITEKILTNRISLTGFKRIGLVGLKSF